MTPRSPGLPPSVRQLARRLAITDWLADWRQDARFALRQVKGARGVTAIVVLTLALGIGANTAIFSVVHRLLLAPLPYANGNRIVMPVGGAGGDFPFPDRPRAELLRAWLARTHTIEGIAGAAELMFTVQPDGTVDTITTAVITSNFLSILGERPELGRTFRPEEERTSAPTVAMISHAMWQRAYGGRRDVLGRTVEHEGSPVTIVGVTPPGLAVPLSTNAAPDIWLPGPLEQAGDGNGAIGARLREPATQWRPTPGPWSIIVGIVDDTRTPEVHGEVAAVQVYSLYPPRLGNVPFIVRTRASGDVSAPMVKHAIASLDPGIYVRAMTSGDTYLRDGLAPTRFAMALLTVFALLALALAAVGLFGVIAYGVTQRTREIGVRIALGAEPRTIVTRVMGSGARLALAGVVIGTALALASVRVLRSMLYEVSPDDPLTIVAIVAIVVIVTLVASYVPARRALRIEPTEALRAD